MNRTPYCLIIVVDNVVIALVGVKLRAVDLVGHQLFGQGRIIAGVVRYHSKRLSAPPRDLLQKQLNNPLAVNRVRELKMPVARAGIFCTLLQLAEGSLTLHFQSLHDLDHRGPAPAVRRRRCHVQDGGY